jgi:hypothetical protein
MADALEEAERSTELLLEATKRLRETLRTSETLYRRTVRGLQRGSGVTATIRANRAEVARQQLTDQLKEFETRRHLSRLSLIAAQLAEGESIGEIARSWGFSRQLASKFAHEAREAFDPEH